MWCLSRARGSEGWGKVIVNVSSYEAADEMRHVFIVIALYGPVDPSEPNGKGCKSSKLWWQLRSQVGGVPMNRRDSEILFSNPVRGKCHAAYLWEFFSAFGGPACVWSKFEPVWQHIPSIILLQFWISPVFDHFYSCVTGKYTVNTQLFVLLLIIGSWATL